MDLFKGMGGRLQQWLRDRPAISMSSAWSRLIDGVAVAQGWSPQAARTLKVLLLAFLVVALGVGIALRTFLYDPSTTAPPWLPWMGVVIALAGGALLGGLVMLLRRQQRRDAHAGRGATWMQP